MRSLKKSIIALTCVLAFVSAASAQNPIDPASVFQELKTAETTDRAKETLLKGGAEDARVREYLKNNLPPMIEVGYRNVYPQWANAVRLAGELKITEAAPALAKWVGLDNVGETSMGQFQRLDNNPAAKALSQIGDPAIPSLVGVLDHGTVRERKSAYMALNLIGSPSAKTVVRGRYTQETDPGLRKLMEMLAPQ